MNASSASPPLSPHLIGCAPVCAALPASTNLVILRSFGLYTKFGIDPERPLFSFIAAFHLPPFPLWAKVCIKLYRGNMSLIRCHKALPSVGKMKAPHASMQGALFIPEFYNKWEWLIALSKFCECARVPLSHYKGRQTFVLL
jgi:hypothetical protein